MIPREDANDLIWNDLNCSLINQTFITTTEAYFKVDKNILSFSLDSTKIFIIEKRN